MSPEQKAAHEHLQKVLTVRTHKAPESVRENKHGKPRGRYAPVTPEILEDIKRLEASGVKRREIARLKNIHETTIHKRLGAKRKAKQADTLRKLRG